MLGGTNSIGPFDLLMQARLWAALLGSQAPEIEEAQGAESEELEQPYGRADIAGLLALSAIAAMAGLSRQELSALLLMWVLSQAGNEQQYRPRDLGSFGPQRFNGQRSASWSPGASNAGRNGSSGATTNAAGGSGGGLPTGSTAKTVPEPPGMTHYAANVPFISQHDSIVPGAGNDACKRASDTMLRQAGQNASTYDGGAIRVASGEDGNGVALVNPGELARGIEYLDSQLAQGKGVVVGLSYNTSQINTDGITDHFVVITGKGVDDEGREFYTYHDPWAKTAEEGANHRFYVDAETGNLYDPNGLLGSYTMTNVRPEL
jgi:hypothetical protein